MEAVLKQGPCVLDRELIREYLADRASAGASEVALKREKKHLTVLCSFLQGQPMDRPLLQQWRNELVGKGLSGRTVADYVITVDRYLRFIGYDELCFPRGSAVDLTGARFGRLTVLGLTDRVASDRSRIWRCRCDRGALVEVPANQLQFGRYKSCGCGKKDRLREVNGYVDDICLKLVLSDTVRSDNTSGVKGVYRVRGRWGARIQYRKRIYCLGYYLNKEDAVRARKQAEAWVKGDAQALWDRFQAGPQEVDDIKGRGE